MLKGGIGKGQTVDLFINPEFLRLFRDQHTRINARQATWVPIRAAVPNSSLIYRLSSDSIEVKATGKCRSNWHGWKGYDADVAQHDRLLIPRHEFRGIVVVVEYNQPREETLS